MHEPSREESHHRRRPVPRSGRTRRSGTPGGRQLLSLIIPVYYNEDNIPVTYEALASTLSGLPEDVDWEIIFIDDGSGDDSYARLLDVQRSAPTHVRVLKFTRNFGQVAAILAGFEHAAGDCCVVMSADLQDPPELILEMVKRWNKGERKIVLAKRESREDGLFARWTSRAFYRLMRRYALPNMPDGGFDFFLIDRDVRDIIHESGEKNSFLQGQVLWTGFEPELIPYTRRRREIGRSRWTLSKKVKYFVDGFVSYTETPIRLITVMGLVVSAMSFAYASLILMLKLFWRIPVEGWAPIMITLLMLGGIQMVMLGVTGEYIWRNSHESRNRPNFVIESVVDESEAATQEDEPHPA
jgi:dolichol-phosphate mannosyltransferase